MQTQKWVFVVVECLKKNKEFDNLLHYWEISQRKWGSAPASLLTSPHLSLFPHNCPALTATVLSLAPTGILFLAWKVLLNLCPVCRLFGRVSPPHYSTSQFSHSGHTDIYKRRQNASAWQIQPLMETRELPLDLI